MLVRDAGDSWSLVLQTDHGALTGQFARAWRPRPDHMHSLDVLATRHDDGWLIWEKAPGLDREGRPCNYLDVNIESHIAFYRAAITAIREQDPYAGVLLSMHGAGIYRSRYGLQPSLVMSLAGEARRLVDDFVAAEERSHKELAAELGVTDEERWHGYQLLQAWDRISLYASLNDLEEPAAPGEQPYSTIESVPFNGAAETLRITARGGHRAAVDPFPFGSEPVSFELPRRIVPKRSWVDADEFRADFDAAEPGIMRFTLEPV
jgi:hypothetical protein